MKPPHRHHVIFAIVCGFLIANCAGGGQGCGQGCVQSCSCMEPLPGGFPQAEQLSGALQLRVAEPGLRFLEKNTGPLIEQLMPGGLSFEVPAACDQIEIPLLGGVHLCGDKSGGTCQAADPPCALQMAITGAKLAPEQSSGDRLKVLARVRAATPPGSPIFTSGAIDCQILLDTAKTGKPDIGFVVDVRFVTDPSSKRTQIALENPDVVDLDGGDLEFKGDLACLAGNLGFVKNLLIDQIKGQLLGEVTKLADSALCAPCAEDSDCPGQASCDKADGVCRQGEACAQSLGIEGRLKLTDLPGGDPAAGLDTLAWLGGGNAMPAGGMTLGMLSGFAPATPAVCVKPRPELRPSLDPVQPSPTLTGNKAPDGKPFHIALGIHKRLLEHAGWAAYTTGALCLEVGTELSELLASDTFGLLMPSLAGLTGGNSVPMVLALRPATPPKFELGKGTLTDNGGGSFTIDEPLITIKLEGLAIDFFALIEQRPTRVLRLTSDVELPLALALTADGTIEPVLGDLSEAFKNLEVTHSELLKEKPEDLANMFPVVLQLAMGFLPDALAGGSFTLPDLGGIQLQDARFTAVDNNTMVALFANLGIAAPPAPTPATPAARETATIETEAQMAMIKMPADPRVMRLRTAGDLARGPRVVVDVAGTRHGTDEPLEYSWRLDGAGWSPYVAGPRLEIGSPLLFLLGEHRLEVRGRVRGRPATVDPRPALLTFAIVPPPTAAEAAAGATEATGCAVGGAPGGGWATAWLLGLLALGRRRPRRLKPLAAALVLLLGAGCSDSSSSVGGDDAGADGADGPAACADGEYLCQKTGACAKIDKTCKTEPGCEPTQEIDYGAGPFMDEEACEPIAVDCTCKDKPPLAHGPLGLHSALAASGDRLLACAYERSFGDLVLVSASLADPATLTKQPIDGVPDAKPTAGPSGYRGGISAPGEDVGLHGDIAVSKGGAITIAYHDADNRSLKIAQAAGTDGPWKTHTVAVPASDQEVVGRFTSLSLDGETPEVAFLVLNKAEADGAYAAELRWARASGATPGAAADWTVEVIDSAPMPCRNLCAKGEVCTVAADGASHCQPEGTGCDKCADDEACVGSACVEILADRGYVDVPQATGMWPAAVRTPAGVLVVYHDGVEGTLKAALREGSGWKVATVFGSPGDGVGAFCSATVDKGGMVHVAHQDASQQSLHYLKLDPATLAASSTQTIDDGVRSDSRHPVGADSAIVVADDGTVYVAYQDQLTVDLLLAKSSGDGSWTPFKKDDDDLGRLLKGGGKGYGFYSDLVLHQGKVYGSTFYFEGASETGGEISLFAVP